MVARRSSCCGEQIEQTHAATAVAAVAIVFHRESAAMKMWPSSRSTAGLEHLETNCSHANG
jgi:hypothetical protein